MTAATKPSSSLPRAGDLIANKYRIERMIGAGGMGAVYVAVHELLREKVAIKVLLPEVVSDRDAVTRFINEARNATRIRNEHVAQVKDVDTLPNGAPYMVMEYLEGHDLGQCQRVWGPVPTAPAVDYVLQALDGLADAHAIGIIHRDLKPANLFLTKQPDGTDTIKILDFGISKSTDLSTPVGNDGGVTNTKAVLGSPGYMAPEQIKNAKHVDARADIWSMGVILYKLLTNHKPFNGDTMGEVFAAIFEETPKSIRSFRPDIPPALDEIVIGRCLQRDRERRFRNVAELAHALAPFGKPDSTVSVERMARRLAAAGAGASTVSRAAVAGTMPLGLGGATDPSASVSHVSQVSQVSDPSQSHASSVSHSHASTSHSYPSASQHSHVTGAHPAAVQQSNRTLLLLVIGVLGFLLLGGAAVGAKIYFGKPASAPTPSATTAATLKPRPTETATASPAPTATATAAPSDTAVPVDALPSKSSTSKSSTSATSPTAAMTATAKPTQTSTSTAKPTATAKASAAPSDDILKMRR